MAQRQAVVKKRAFTYKWATRAAKTRILDELCETVGWSRAKARAQLVTARKRKGPVAAVKRKQRAPTYGYDTIKVLQLAGEPCGKYLAAIMATPLPALEDFGELKPVAFRLSPAAREQLPAMSPAMIDRLLKPFKAARYPKVKAATRPGSTLRSTIQVRQAMDEMTEASGILRDRSRRSLWAFPQG